MLSPSPRPPHFDPHPHTSRRTTRSVSKTKATNTMDPNNHASSSKLKATEPRSQMLPPNTIPSCLYPSSAFYQVLTAPYRASIPLPWSSFTTSKRMSRPTNAKASTSNAEASGSSDRSASAASLIAAPTPHQEYKPHGRWAWAEGKLIKDTEELMQLPSLPFVSVSVNRGTLGKQQITYISKCYIDKLPTTQARFQSEVALYASEDHLRQLQGDVVPYIVGVDGATIAMELPHPIFWIEASSEMPESLKQRCVDAYEKIHAQGVLHGDVELQNMLIGGDGKVTITHFQNGRALVSDPAGIVPRAEFPEFAMEMRKVKYKLDYDGARRKEMDKLGRSLARQSNDLMRNVHIDTFGRRSSSGVLPIPVPEEDVLIPPVDGQVWNKSWANDASLARPFRFVLPGYTDDVVAQEVRNFMALLDQAQPATSPVQGRRRVRFGPSQTHFIDTYNMPPPPVPSPASPTYLAPGISSLKRKAPEPSTSAVASSSKRPRYGTPLPLQPKEEEEDELIVPGGQLAPDPILVQYMQDNSPDKVRFTPPRPSPPDVLPTSASRPTSALTDGPRPPLPPVRSRDFAYEAYEGPKGYYAPYPFLEAACSLNRKKFIKKQNEQQCAELGLPHPRLARPSGGAWSSMQFDRKAPRKAIGLGTIKRQARAANALQKRKMDDVEMGSSGQSSAQKRRKLSPVRELEPSPELRVGSSSKRPGPDVTYGQMLAPSQIIVRPRALFTAGENVPTTREHIHSNRSARAGDRIAFATLGMLPPSSSTRRPTSSGSADPTRSRRPRPLSSTATDGTFYDGIYHPSQRLVVAIDLDDSDASQPALSERSPSPTSSEDEVEEMLLSSPFDCPPTSWTPLGSWMGSLLRWIQ